MLRIVIGNVLLAVVIGFAIAGSRSTRAVGLIFAAGVLSTFGLSAVGVDYFRTVQWSVAAVDAAVFAAFIYSNWKYREPWISWIAAIQLIVLAGHPVRAFHPLTVNWIYYAFTALWIYPQLGILATATWRHAQSTNRLTS